MSLKSSIKYELRCLLVLLALYSVVFQSVQAHYCTKKYYSINTIENVSEFKVTCYAKYSGCGIYLDQNGQGCTSGGLVYAGRVSANQTDKITLPLNVGNGICSAAQISAQVTRSSGELVQLPRASDAGTKFFVNLQTVDVPFAGYEISLQTLAENATVSYRFHPDDPVSSQKLGSYQFWNGLQNSVPESKNFYMEIESTAPILATMRDTQRGNSGVYQVLQPVSSETVVVYNQNYISYFSMAVVDCDTNQLQPDTSRVKLQFSGLHGHSCEEKLTGDSPFSYYLFSGCLVTVTPLDDNTCVSTYAQNGESVLTSVGAPKSKLSTRLGSHISESSINILSFSNESCYDGLYRHVKEEVTLDWIPNVYDGEIATSLYSLAIPTDRWIECPRSAYFLMLANFKKATMLLGFESERNWQQFFIAEGC